jgi:predicted peptidase
MIFPVKAGLNLGVLLSFLLSLNLVPGGTAKFSGQSALKLPLQGQEVDHINYLLYLPAGYGRDIVSQWPLILFLHGSEERGDDPLMVKEYGIPSWLDKRDDFPFIVVSPQCPAGLRWSPAWINSLLDEVEAKLRVDDSRVYLTGFSMGGYGTWDTAVAYPERFAAIAPIAGGGNEQLAGRLKNMPIWAFHGEMDPNVPVSESISMVEAVKPFTDEAKLTIYPNMTHDVWTKTYQNSDLYSWFLAHSKTAPDKSGARSAAGSQKPKTAKSLPAPASPSKTPRS